MQPTKMTRAEYQAKFGTAPQAPVVSTVQKSTTQTPSAKAPIKMTRSEYESKFGSSPEVPEKAKTFTQKALDVAKSIVEAPATIVARPIQALAVGGARLFGGQQSADKTADTLDKFSKNQLGGFVAPIPREASEVKQDVGRGIQTVALGAPGVATGGALFGVGNSLEQGNDLFSTQTAFQGVLGGAGGKILDLVGKPLLNAAGKVIGKITPDVLKNVASRGAGAISEFAANHSILPKTAGTLINKGAETAESVFNAPTNIVKNVLKKGSKNAEQQLEDKYVELFEGGSPTKQKQFFNTQKVTEAKNLAGTEGNPPQRTLAQAHIIPKQEGAKIKTLEQADEFRQTAKPLQEVNRAALQEVEAKVPKINLRDQEEKAVALIKTPRNINEGTAKSLEKEIRSEYADLRAHYGEEVPITTLDDIKSARWKPIPFDKMNSARPLLGDANYAIAKTGQKTIEEVAKSVGAENVAQLNRHIGDIMEGAKYLEGLNGRTIKGSGMQSLALKGAGFFLGNSIPAKIAGYFGGEAIANMVVANKLSGPIQRMILKNIENKEGPEALKATMKWISEQQAKSKIPQLALPAKGQSTIKDTYYSTPGGKVSSIKQEASDIAAQDIGAVKQPKAGPSKRVQLRQMLENNEQYKTPAEMPVIKAGNKGPSAKSKRLKDLYGNLPTIKGSAPIKTIATGAALTGGAVLGASKLKNMYDSTSTAQAAEVRPAEKTPEETAPKVVKTQKIDGKTVHTLDSGTQVVDMHPNIQKVIDKVYKNNPDIEPGVLETLVMKESTGGYDDRNKNPKIGSKAWIGGIAGKSGAKGELDRLKIPYNLDTVEGTLDAMAKYWTLLKDRKGNKEKDPVSIYDKGYSSGKLKDSDIKKFKDFLEYYSSKNR